MATTALSVVTNRTNMNDHKDSWDCIEQMRTKKIAGAETPNAPCDDIEMYECQDCGRRHMVECWADEDGVYDINIYFLKDPYNTEFKDVLQDY